MPHDDFKEITIRDQQIMKLHEHLGEYGFLSEDFWTDFDQLKVLLLDAIQIAHRLGLEEYASRYQKMFDELMDSVPSGYWK